ncbi:MAG: hypothetical protein ACD_72C00053G0004 [uncultured bacterium]|nr:MAG: hypothetical protein ACD_72C00053G0004 [uncultured bacterium]
MSKESNFLLYTTPTGDVRVEVLFSNETVWLTQKRLADLFETTPQNVTIHLKNIYSEAEISESATCKEFLQVQKEGGRNVERKVLFYNLDAIISVGYRVNSEKALRFRQWATKTLHEYVIKGFVLDDERLKNGAHFGKDYFEDLLERIREIRLSERRLYQKIADIYETAADYDFKSETTKTFFAFVQNKLHYAITGKTAAEIIRQRANSEKKNMGLTTWKQSPKGKIVKTDIGIAKNYLNEKELASLRRIVSAFLDLAEDRAKRGIVTTMAQWIEFIDNYLKLGTFEILQSTGSISHEQAVKYAEKEYEKYRVVQDSEFISDFDRAMQKYLGSSKLKKPAKCKV